MVGADGHCYISTIVVSFYFSLRLGIVLVLYDFAFCRRDQFVCVHSSYIEAGCMFIIIVSLDAML